MLDVSGSEAFGAEKSDEEESLDILGFLDLLDMDV
jgi:hypothetical protein